ncbi:MAG: hypothetical protein HN383_17555 [Verrucomicrobia bacterium]|jgi:hypothetical protein|nr:hypothetical protein [Verrucomicrobiota bacterium]
MKKLITLFAIAGMVLALAPAAQAADLAWTSGISGDYRIMFTTYGTTAATSTDITTYNAFVQGQADADADILALGATWNAVASTATHARDNTLTAGTGDANDVPIYYVDGTLLALNNAALWGPNPNGAIANPNGHVAAGARVVLELDGTEAPGGTKVWTGTLEDGTRCPNSGDKYQLGQNNVQFGFATAAGQIADGRDNTWLIQNNENGTNPKPMYALSNPITAGGGSTPGTLIYGK